MTIWDSITAGENDKRKREQDDLQSWLMQNKAADDSEHSRATTRMLDENASTVSWERQQKMQEAQDAAYGAIQTALDNGDTQYADYLSRTHLGTKLEDLTPPDNGTLPLTFDDEGPGGQQAPQAPPGQQAPPQPPPQPQGSGPQASPALGQQPMYGPDATPDIMANAASRDFKRDPGAGRETWMSDHPGEAGTPDAAAIEQYLREQAAAKQSAMLESRQAPTQPPPFVPQQGPQRAPAPMVPQAPPQQQAQPQIQATAQTYSPQIQAAQEQARRYRAGDIVFDPGARAAARERAAAKAERQRQAALQASIAEAPAIKDFLLKNDAMQRMKIDAGKSGEEYFKGQFAGENQHAKFRDLKDLKLSLEAADHENDMAEIGLKNRGSLDVAGVRARKGKGAGGGGGNGGVEMLDAKARKAALQQIGTENNSTLRQFNYPKLLQQYQRGKMAEDAINSGNPAGTGLATEALISSHRGAAATEAFLKAYEKHQQSGFVGNLQNYIEKVASGGLGEEARNNLKAAVRTSLDSIRQSANEYKQAWSQQAFSPDNYGVKGNYEALHDKLWTPFGFEPIKRDPGGGAISLTGQRRTHSDLGQRQPTIGEKLMGGKPKKRAEDMLDELLK